MELAHRWINRDLSRLELVIALLIMTILIGTFMNHALRVFAHAERSSVMVTVTNINNALLYHSLSLVGKNKWRELVDMESMNPMQLMRGKTEKDIQPDRGTELKITDNEIPVGNYLGEFSDPDISMLESGKWYYDTRVNTLVYMVNNDEFFISDMEGPARIVYEIVIVYKDIDGNGSFDPSSDEFSSVKLVEVSNTAWDI